MKTILKYALGTLTVGLVMGVVVTAQAEPKVQTESFHKALRAVPAPEIPAKAASLVVQAEPGEQQEVAVSVVQAAVKLAPAMAAEITAVIARQAPATAASAAAAAAALQPKSAPTIARLATISAPKYAGEIVSAVCRKLPASYSEVAIEVASAAPDAGQSILSGLVQGVPSLKPFIERAVFLASTSASASPSIPKIMSLTAILVKRAADNTKVSPEKILAGASTPTKEQVALSSIDLVSLSDLDSNPPRPGKKPGQTNHGRGHAYGHTNSYSGP